MTTATQPAATPKPAASNPTIDRGAQLLDELISKASDNEKIGMIRLNLEKRRDTISALTPEAFKGHNLDRWIKRAMLYLSSKPDIQKHATGAGFASFVECVMKAAELGLCIDGRLAHAVPFKGKLTFMIDYKGMIAVAKRAKAIVDCEGVLVYEKDEFSAWREDGQSKMIHKPCLTADRGKVIGAYARIWLPGGQWRFEWMNAADIDAIRQRSPAKNSGPWVTDTGEMQKKTILKRALKTYCQDPLVNALFESDNEDFDAGALEATVSKTEDLLAKDRAARAAKQQTSPPPVPKPDPAEVFAEFGHRIDNLAEKDIDGGKLIKAEIDKVKDLIGEEDWMNLNDKLADRVRESEFDDVPY